MFLPFDIFYDILTMIKAIYLQLIYSCLHLLSRTHRFLVCLFILSVGFTSADAQRSGFALLDIAPNPFALSLSEAGSAWGQGGGNSFANPSLLVNSKRSSVEIGYTNWIADTKNIFGSYHKKLEQRAFSISFYSSGLQDLEQRNEPGPSNGLFSIQYLSISTAYAQSFRWFNVGASVHYLSEEIYPYRSNGYAFNVGLSCSFAKDRIHIGTAVRSLGEMQRLDVEKTPLPKAWISGLSIGLLEWNGSKNPELPVFMRTHLDYVYPLNNESNLSQNTFINTEAYARVGVEVLVAETLQLTTGFRTDNTARPHSFGVGYILSDIRFNYAIIPFETGFGTVHSVGLQYLF